MPYIGIFGQEFYKNYCHIWNQHPQICLIANFHEKNKNAKMWDKNALFEYFWPKISYLDIFGLELKKSYFRIWNQHPWICLIAKSCEIMKMPKFGTKSVLFGYFSTRILKNYCHVWNQHFRNSVIAKFCEETKMPKFGTEITIFGYFWQKMPYLSI